MPSLYLNRLSNEERQQLIDRLLNTQVGKCFICGKAIELDVHSNYIDIDHVEPIKVGGKDGPDNFAVTHDSCNRTKQASDLRVARSSRPLIGYRSRYRKTVLPTSVISSARTVVQNMRSQLL